MLNGIKRAWKGYRQAKLRRDITYKKSVVVRDQIILDELGKGTLPLRAEMMGDVAQNKFICEQQVMLLSEKRRMERVK